MLKAEPDIRAYMESRGIDPFWAGTHVDFLRFGASQQGLIVERVANQTLTKRGAHVKEYKATATVTDPATGLTCDVTLRYTFNPNLRKGHHKLWLPKPEAEWSAS